jgi:hypothetical protein
MDAEEDEWQGYKPFGGFSDFCNGLTAFGFELLADSISSYILGTVIGLILYSLFRAGLL